MRLVYLLLFFLVDNTIVIGMSILLGHLSLSFEMIVYFETMSVCVCRLRDGFVIRILQNVLALFLVCFVDGLLTRPGSSLTVQVM